MAFLIMLVLGCILSYACHNIPLPALPVLALFGATNDWLQGLPAWIGDRRSGIRIADIDCLGQQWSRLWPPD